MVVALCLMTARYIWYQTVLDHTTSRAHFFLLVYVDDKSSPCGGSGFPFSLSEWSLTICLTPYNRKENVLSASLNKIKINKKKKM